MVFPIARLPKGIPHRAVFFHFGRAIEPKQRFWLFLTHGLTSLEIFREEKDLAVGICGFRSGIYGESLPLAAFTWQKRFAYNPLSSWSTSNEYFLLGHRWASKINNILEATIQAMPAPWKKQGRQWVFQSSTEAIFNVCLHRDMFGILFQTSMKVHQGQMSTHCTHLDG